ncbi:putative UDP-rhamnose:rhamnosyltransferase 1 [Vitis riparia]|uniref:putative UDP-rhamnose:rhamnosyltransferase 1 n=1 Tax=Vitis riparia TaxID=96939 RepID=UPI00155B3BB0|nr:putative UDP-rhamnose:rhamnosyltransferase 1 [Vitis riparia]
MAGNMHVVMAPWLAFGHMIPHLQLAIALAEAGIHVSFISTPRNIQRLPKLSPTLLPLINLVALPLPAVLGWPEGCEATVDLPFEKIKYLKIAYALLKQPLKRFLEGASPDWMIVDLPVDWAAEAARECGVPLLAFTMFTSASNVFFRPPEYLTGDGQRRVRPSPESMTTPPEWVTFPSLVAYREFEARGAHPGFYGDNSSGTTDADRIATTLSACDAVAIRSCREFEGEYLSIYQKMLRKPVIPVGLLPREGSHEITNQAWRKIFKWLDEQKPKSVVFVGFGSECKLSQDQVHEIAYGLELSELPFLWALRKPDWAIEDVDALPSGYSDRTSGRGVVCMEWAPQMEILAHPSIGGSLFHSGWGSAIETLQFGQSPIVLPFVIDQGLNARLLVEKGMAVEIERGDDGSFSRDDIAKSLRLAMVMEEGEKLRIRAREAAMIFGDQKLHQSYIDELVKYLKGGIAKVK